MKYRYFILLLLLLGAFSVSAQDEDEKKKFSDYVDLSGYIKNMQNGFFVKKAESLVTGNLIHNRLNLHIYPHKTVEVAVESRNRMFTGEQIQVFPNYSQFIAQDQGYVNLSHLWVDKQTIIVHTIIDRAWASYSRDKWNVRIGRQRINWGINTTWNPNDIFNTYNFLDFDYEERPGTDALRFQYYTGMMSSVELAVKAADSLENFVGALKYNFNKWTYDVQVFGGIFNTDAVAALGWAGNLWDAGFKGEFSYFHPYENYRDTSGQVSFSTAVDYSFRSGWYVSSGYLYNSTGGDDFSVFSLLNANLSAKSLMPTKHNILLQTSKSFNPLISGNLIVIFSPKANTLITVPTVTYSIKENWDIDLIGQSFFAEMPDGKFDTMGNSVYLRLKWSF